MNAVQYALTVLSGIQTLVAAGSAVAQIVSDAGLALQTMQDQNRDPTPEEWANINERIKAALDQLNA